MLQYLCQTFSGAVSLRPDSKKKTWGSCLALLGIELGHYSRYCQRFSVIFKQDLLARDVGERERFL